MGRHAAVPTSAFADGFQSGSTGVHFFSDPMHNNVELPQII